MSSTSAPKPSRQEGLRTFGLVPFSRLTTFRQSGTPVGVPIWQAADSQHIYMFTEADSWKVKRLRNNPRIEITTCNWRGVLDGGATWTGTARVVDSAADVAKAYAALDAKYGWQKTLTDLMSKVSGRYDARAILEITLDD